MIPLALFLLACATVYVGTVEAAFTTLMRLSLRLGAERRGRLDRLGYLDDPLRLFVPVRVLQSVLVVAVATLALVGVGARDAASVALTAGGWSSSCSCAATCCRSLSFAATRSGFWRRSCRRSGGRWRCCSRSRVH